MTKSRVNPLSLLFDLLIDFALIGFGAAFYYHFEVASLGPFDLNPLVTHLFGSKYIAVLVISIIPFVIGALNLLRTPGRVFKAMLPSQNTQ